MPIGIYKRKITPWQDRFWDKVEKTATCWIWKAAQYPWGYGMINTGDRNMRAHRLSYEMVNGPIPKGLELDHLCRVPSCVRPDHLEAVSHKENMRRSMAGIISGQMQRAKKLCRNGHSYSGTNLIIRKNGRRECRTCKNYFQQKRRGGK